MNLQYRMTSADMWADVPSYALMGTYNGTIELQYPETSDFDGLGRACGAVGQPKAVIKANAMTSCGMMFWQSRFSTSVETSSSIYLMMFDSRSGSSGSGAWTSVSGHLMRPKYSRVKVGGDDATRYGTIFYDVEIAVNNCAVLGAGYSWDAGDWDAGISIDSTLDGGTWS